MTKIKRVLSLLGICAIVTFDVKRYSRGGRFRYLHRSRPLSCLQELQVLPSLRQGGWHVWRLQEG